MVGDWEAATAPAAEAGLRVVTVRTGLVQAAGGGTLKLLRPPFAAGLGGRLGDGRQWLSWIGLDDLVDVYHRALYDTRLVGPVNAVAPQAVRNSEYTKVLAGVMRRPAVLPVPSIGPRLLLGAQGARELAEADQHVLPTKLQAVDHRFRASTVDRALTNWAASRWKARGLCLVFGGPTGDPVEKALDQRAYSARGVVLVLRCAGA